MAEVAAPAADLEVRKWRFPLPASRRARLVALSADGESDPVEPTDPGIIDWISGRASEVCLEKLRP
jgi:hypothetical protein